MAMRGGECPRGLIISSPRGAGWRVASRASGAPACMAMDVRGARAYPPKRELTTKKGDRLSQPMGRERALRQCE